MAFGLRALGVWVGLPPIRSIRRLGISGESERFEITDWDSRFLGFSVFFWSLGFRVEEFRVEEFGL